MPPDKTQPGCVSASDDGYWSNHRTIYRKFPSSGRTIPRPSPSSVWGVRPIRTRGICPVAGPLLDDPRRLAGSFSNYPVSSGRNVLCHLVTSLLNLIDQRRLLIPVKESIIKVKVLYNTGISFSLPIISDQQGLDNGGSV
jgi:hypothetical protein